jgi:hypothetical protein
MVQIRIRPGVKETEVVEKVRSLLRAEFQHETPAQLERKSADAVGLKRDWLTISQLNALAAREESSWRRFDQGYLLLALTVFIALGAFLLWLLRRQRTARQRSDIRLDSPQPPISGGA